MTEYGEANVQAHIRALSLSALDWWRMANCTASQLHTWRKNHRFLFSLRNEFVNFNYCTLAIIIIIIIIRIFMDWLLFSSDYSRLIVASIFHTDVLFISFLFVCSSEFVLQLSLEYSSVNFVSFNLL